MFLTTTRVPTMCIKNSNKTTTDYLVENWSTLRIDKLEPLRPHIRVYVSAWADLWGTISPSPSEGMQVPLSPMSPRRVILSNESVQCIFQIFGTVPLLYPPAYLPRSAFVFLCLFPCKCSLQLCLSIFKILLRLIRFLTIRNRFNFVFLSKL